MELFNSALGRNITFVRPAYFIISGFIGIPNVKFYYVFLFFVYIVSVLANSFVMAVIYLDHNLKTPKYVAVFNMAFVDLCANTALVPKLLDIFLFNHRRISYNDCLAFLFFCFTCLGMQSLNLVALSYDRLVAIIFPLHYQVKMTNRFMLSLVVYFWLAVIVGSLFLVGLLTRLSFCKSVVINSYFCDHGPLFRLACNDITPSYIIGHICLLLFLWFPWMFILLSYLYIGYTLSKVAAMHERLKALKTCMSHLSLVAIFFLPLAITFCLMENIHPNGRIINLSLTSVFPPMLNPIVYVLQTQEIRQSVRKLLKIKGRTGIEIRKVDIS